MRSAALGIIIQWHRAGNYQQLFSKDLLVVNVPHTTAKLLQHMCMERSRFSMRAEALVSPSYSRPATMPLQCMLHVPPVLTHVYNQFDTVTEWEHSMQQVVRSLMLIP